MQCQACDAQNPDGNRFCGACGRRLPAACPRCGNENPADNRFCGACGAALAAPAEAVSPAPANAEAASPCEADAPAGERRQVTVLFADLSDFTALSRRLDAEEMHALLNRFFEAVDAVVDRYGGAVDKHIGDSVMAVFGAPVAHGNDPLRAVRCALDMHAEMGRLREELAQDLTIHIGIASGEVVASGTGSARRSDYTVTGDSVNLAARLDDMAGPGETLVSGAVHAAVGDQVSCAAVGAVDVKGFEHPVEVWRVERLVQAATHRDARPLVGRAGELRQFAGAVATVLETGRGQILYLRGEAGIGKTRVAEEFRAAAATQGFACHAGFVLDFGVGRGQDAVRSIVRSLLALDAGDGDEVRRKAAERAVADGVIAMQQAVFLYDLLDLPQPPEQRAVYDAMDGDTRARGAHEAVAALLRHATMRRPVLVTVEDIHWADRALLAHLAALAKTVADCPILLVMTSRLEGDPIDEQWRAAARGSPLLTIDLAPLREGEALEMAGALGRRESGFVRICVERAGGNPLFLEQLLRSGEEGSMQTVPGSVQSLVLARMDVLAPADRVALQAASVIGQRFSLDVVRHLTGDADYAAEPLVAHHLVRPEADGYIFAHALVRDGVYSSLLKRRRRSLHRRAAEWFSKRDPVLCAEHLERAEDEAAPRAFLDAAKEQMAEFRYERAATLAQRGLALARSPADRFALTLLSAQLQRRRGAPRDSIATYRRALDLADGDRDRCRARIGIAAGVRLLGGYDEGVDVLGPAQEAAARAGLDLELAQIHFYRGTFFFAAGRIDDCLAEQKIALDHARASGDAEWEARTLGGLGDAHYARGRMRRALEYYRRCIALAERHGFGRVEVANRYMVGVTRRYMNEFDAAMEDVAAAVDMARRVGDRRALMYALNLQGEFLVERCELEAAERVLSETRTIADAVGNRRFSAYTMTHQARARLLEGRRAEALEILRAARAITRETGETFVAPRVLGVAALAAADDRARERALAEGAAILARGCNAHNHLWFHRDAVDACLWGADWDGAEAHADALVAFTETEPLPWAMFFAARGRALAAHGRGVRNDEVAAELHRLREEAAGIGLRVALPALDAALEAMADSSEA